MRRRVRDVPLADDPQWYRDAIIYELRVRSYMDSNGDGIGDFEGLTSKLDYLQDLGVTALWLLPVMPSPGRDDGYDIADYTEVHPELGTLDDFKRLLAEAHRRGLRVITELVLNHTSDQHPWFQRARRAATGTPERDFYVWSDTPDRYADARIIFKDFEPSNWSWDPVAKQYFWHRFYAHQPDVNFDNPAVQEAMLGVVDFWFGLGVDGLRLDAVPYLFEREGTSCENLPETHAYLKRLRAHVDARFKHRLLLAEANQWPEDAAAYFGSGDECHMNFHFPIMPRMFMAIHLEDRLPIIDILAQTPPLAEGCQWALFLRNHDELTLEMVSEEERDAMYRAYAQDPAMRINLGIRRRLAPLVGNDRRRIELMNSLLFSLPGTPVLYYGDEIGMGDNVFLGDRNGVRTPMQWSPDRNAGFSRANPQRLILPIIIDPAYHYESLNVEAQQDNASSLLWWTKRAIALRKRFRAFGRGSVDILSPDNPHVLAFVRRWENETLLVVANLSRFVQYVELNLSALKGSAPVELFGRTRFPSIGDLPYLLTLGGHECLWFSIEPAHGAKAAAREAAWQAPTLDVSPPWDSVFAQRDALSRILPAWLEGRAWYEGRGREVAQARVDEVLPLGAESALAFVAVEYDVGDPETYVVPLAIVHEPRATEVRGWAPHVLVANLRGGAAPAEVSSDASGAASGAALVDALADPKSAAPLYEAIRAAASVPGEAGVLRGWTLAAVPSSLTAEPHALKNEHKSAAVGFGDAAVVKLHRRHGVGTGPDAAVGRVLAARAPTAPTAPLLGALEWARRGAEPITVATLHGLVPNEGTARQWLNGELHRFFERALTAGRDRAPPVPAESLVARARGPVPPDVAESLGGILAAVRLLARRTAELHRALALPRDDAAFAPVPYTSLDQRSLYQSRRNLTGKALRLLRTRAPTLPPAEETLARELLAREAQLYRRFEPLLDRRLTVTRGRVHGEWRLSNALFTGKDFVAIDFDGDPARPLSDRKRKRAPLRDVATMVRSLERTAWALHADTAVVRESDRAALEPWVREFAAWSGAAFLGAWLEAAAGASFVPKDDRELALLVDTLVLEKLLDELTGALEHRPAAVAMTLRALVETLVRGSA